MPRSNLRRCPRRAPGWALRCAAMLAVLLALAAPAAATWSIVAVDRATGRLVIASATCVPQQAIRSFPSEGLWDVQAIVVPGRGVAAAQAAVDRTRENQMLIRRELAAGDGPRRHPGHAGGGSRSRGSAVRHRGPRGSLRRPSPGPGTEPPLSGSRVRSGNGIHVAIQGNLLASDAVVLDAMAAFLSEGGTLEDRVMAAMEAADRAGGDARCMCTTPAGPRCALRPSDRPRGLPAGRGSGRCRRGRQPTAGATGPSSCT
jgi:hypothetical protein